MMFRGLSTAFTLLWKTAFHNKVSHARWTPKRFAVMAIFAPLIFFGQIIHWIGFWLDDIFFRGYRKIVIKEPVFIIGIPRSGTTHLHRVMALDTDRFASPKLWEILIAPSITERKAWIALGRIDQALGGYIHRIVVAIDAKIFRQLRDIHKMSLFDYDEDDMALIQIFSTIYLFFPFPFRETMWRFALFDAAVPPAEKERIMRFYKAYVQRHLYVHGPHKHFLSKNPTFSAKVNALREHFPDARVVCNMRSPFDTVPSLISTLTVVWRTFDNDSQGHIFRDLVLEMAGYWYRNPMTCAQAWPEDRFIFLTHDVLTANLEAAVTDLYNRFGFDMTPQYAQCLEQLHIRSRAFKSGHQYSLEDFGLTPEMLLVEFQDVFKRFNFDTTYPVSAPAGDTPV